MRVKLDENRGTRGVQIFRKHGHDVASVAGQGLQSSSDRDLIRVCGQEDRRPRVRPRSVAHTPKPPPCRHPCSDLQDQGREAYVKEGHDSRRRVTFEEIKDLYDRLGIPQGTTEPPSVLAH